MLTPDEQVTLVEKIINGDNVTENYAKLFISLKNLLYSIINTYDPKFHYDLFQEMFFALIKSVEEYKKSKGKYRFHSILRVLCKQRAISFLRKWYGTEVYKEKNTGKIRTNTLSLNAIVEATEDGAIEYQDILVSETDIEREYIESDIARLKNQAVNFLFYMGRSKKAIHAAT